MDFNFRSNICLTPLNKLVSIDLVDILNPKLINNDQSCPQEVIRRTIRTRVALFLSACNLNKDVFSRNDAWIFSLHVSNDGGLSSYGNLPPSRSSTIWAFGNYHTY